MQRLVGVGIDDELSTFSGFFDPSFFYFVCADNARRQISVALIVKNISLNIQILLASSILDVNTLKH